MSADAALKAARDAGIRIGIDGDDLVLEASAKPSPAVLELLSQNKAGIRARLRAAEHGWGTEDWQAFFDERASIAEFDAGLPRPQAEARAFDCCIAEWMNQNPVHSMADRCIGCGGGDRPGDPLLPFGIESHGHAWLHSRCWLAWSAARKAESVAALKVKGLTPR
jgi:hypothetical protein